jgi:hypothetical protein
MNELPGCGKNKQDLVGDLGSFAIFMIYEHIRPRLPKEVTGNNKKMRLTGILFSTVMFLQFLQTIGNDFHTDATNVAKTPPRIRQRRMDIMSDPTLTHVTQPPTLSATAPPTKSSMSESISSDHDNHEQVNLGSTTTLDKIFGFVFLICIGIILA